jgi:phosphatidate phosphatase LPIN
MPHFEPQDAIPEPDFLDLDATQPSPTDGVPPLTTLPPDTAKVQSALDAPAAPLQSENNPASSVEHGTGLIEAAAQMTKEEENERAGRLKDKLIATSNMTNNLRRSEDNKAVPELDIGDEALPNVPKGSPPPIAHLPDVMIDMAGYHSKDTSDQTVVGSESRFRFDDYITASNATRAQEQLMSAFSCNLTQGR